MPPYGSPYPLDDYVPFNKQTEFDLDATTCIADLFSTADNESLHSSEAEVLKVFQKYLDAFQTCKEKTFVITGKVNHFRSKEKLSAMIEVRGGKLSETVSKKTDYLISNDVNSTTKKKKKAKELSIPIITEEEFMKLFNVKS